MVWPIGELHSAAKLYYYRLLLNCFWLNQIGPLALFFEQASNFKDDHMTKSCNVTGGMSWIHCYSIHECHVTKTLQFDWAATALQNSLLVPQWPQYYLIWQTPSN